MIQRINTIKLFKNLYTPKLNSSVVRYATTDKSLQHTDTENWSEIYRLPLIRLASAFNKMKIYQAIVTAAGTPAVLALEQAGHLAPNFGFVFGTLGVTGVITLSLCSLPVNKLIGFIYMNEDNDKVKLGYVDFWGRRKHHVLNIEDILTPWEIPERRINLYQPVTNREDESQSFKLLQRFGLVRDAERFIRVFGDGYA
ncbi:transmembrane protein 186 [Episyrphus balteatus]|uniref:transmembrane protein 186 n=1 Tax=Episyrphus balteatus TaxID=286459 RepID=UPI0024854F78|nr:transmembrane protein 186 [Episyrphus balteatus]